MEKRFNNVEALKNNAEAQSCDRLLFLGKHIVSCFLPEKLVEVLVKPSWGSVYI